MVEYTNIYKNDLLTGHDVPNIGKLNGKGVLITGAGGLICSALIDQLMMLNDMYQYNIRVYAAGRNKEKLEKRFLHWKNRIHFVEYDSTKTFTSAIPFDYIVHGASPSSPYAYSTQPVETMLANLVGIDNLLQIVKKNGHGRLLYISSSEVYGKKEGSQPYSEEDYGYVDILNSRACYPSSKRAAETLCAAYRKEYGVDFVTVRPGHIYGPTMVDSDNRAASEFLREARQGADIVMKSAGQQMRSYCYVIDCTNAILAVLLNGVSGEAYNISNPQSVVTIRDFAECVAKECDVKVVFENATDSEKASYNLMDNSSLTSEKLAGLGWKGMFDLQAGIKSTLGALKKREET